MGKTIPLITASIKGFMRNWKSVLLLLVLPLVLISLVFYSFNPEGMQRLPVGITGDIPPEIRGAYEQVFPSLFITEFDTLDDCIIQIKHGQMYACMQVIKSDATVVNVHFDNTRDPIIWSVIANIKATVDALQKAQFKLFATDFVDKMKTTMVKVNTFTDNLQQTNYLVDGYITETDNSVVKLSNAKNDLTNTLNQMDSDIANAKAKKSNLKRQKDSYYSTAYSKLNTIQGYADKVPRGTNYENLQYINPIYSGITDAKNEVNYYNTQTENEFTEFDNTIRNYEASSRKGRQYTTDMDNSITKMRGIKNDLVSYKGKIKNAENELQGIKDEFGVMQNLNPELLANPIVMYSNPTYIPNVDIDSELSSAKSVEEKGAALIKGTNKINLQTLYPTILLLITLFLSLLISSFICLNEINASANQRLKLVKGIFLHEIFSTYFSSSLIVVLPVTCVLLVGQYLFRIRIFDNLIPIALIMFIYSSIFILIGMLIAYMIKKESITLLVSTFILIFMTLFSGILLPLERMRVSAGDFSAGLPMKLASTAFNKIIFYERPLSSAGNSIFWLVMWFVWLLLAVVLVKRMRNA